MRKIVIVLALLAVVGCTKTGGSSPTDAARSFNENIIKMNLEKAYAGYSSRIQNSFSFDAFKKNFDIDDREKDSESLKDRLQLEYVDEVIDGVKAIVYGKGTIDGKVGGNFRVRMVMEDGQWKVDSEVFENESFTDPGYYRNMELTTFCHNYIQSMLKGDAKAMWGMTGKNARGDLTMEEFASVTIKTESGKSPLKEGFNYELNEGLAKDSGIGIAYIKLKNGLSKDKVLMEGLVFKLPFVQEDGEWKADFTKIDDRYLFNEQK